MIAAFFVAGWIASVASWTPLKTFTLACSGTQAAYTEETGVKQTLPWSQAFSVDLVGGTYCTQGCALRHPLSALTTDGLDLDNTTGHSSSTLRRFHAASGQVEMNVITAASANQRFHLEQTGTCTIKPPSGGA